MTWWFFTIIYKLLYYLEELQVLTCLELWHIILSHASIATLNILHLKTYLLRKLSKLYITIDWQC